MDKKKYFQEYEFLEDLVNQLDRFIFRIKYQDKYIYYIGSVTDSTLFIHFCILDEEIKGWISIDQNGKLMTRNIPKVNFIPVINVKYSNLIEELMHVYYKIK